MTSGGETPDYRGQIFVLGDVVVLEIERIVPADGMSRPTSLFINEAMPDRSGNCRSS